MKKHKMSLVEMAMHYRQIVILLVSALVIFGIYSLKVMPKNEFPNITIRQGLVIAVYPGASAEEVETQVAKPLEAFMWQYPEINKEKTYTQSMSGMCVAFVELKGNVNDKDAFWSKFKHGLSTAKMSMPSGVLALLAKDDFGNTSAILLAMESESKTYAELEDYLESLSDKIRSINSVSNIRTYGLQKEQIAIYVDRDKLTDYGISPQTLSAMLMGDGLNTTSGNIDNGRNTLPIRISESMNNINDIAEKIVYSDVAGNVIRVRDVATVVREFPTPSEYITTNKNKCVVLSLEMSNGFNIVEFGDDVKNMVSEFEKQLPNDVKLHYICDQSTVVGDSVNTFLRELLIAICAVILVVMLLLPLRVASVAAATIPISIFIAIGLFYLFGIEINTATLAAMLATLGMVVDNSIVIIDSYLEKIDEGISRWNASIQSAREFARSIIDATLAISVTFFPLLFTMDGPMLDFLIHFPWAIAIILFVSLLVAEFLVPYMQFYFIRHGLSPKTRTGKPKVKKVSFLDLVQKGYEVVIRWCFRHKAFTLGCGAASIVAGALIYTILPQRLLPIAERNQFALEFTLPEGTSLEQTAAVADSMESILRADSRVNAITVFYGSSSPRFHTTYAPNLPGTNRAQFIVNTISNAATVELLDEYAEKYAEYFPEATIRFKQMDYNAVTSPVEIRFYGDNLDDLRSIGDTVLNMMRNNPNLCFVHSNFSDAIPTVRIDIDENEANRIGINKALLSLQLATKFSNGISVTNIWEDGKEVPVVLKDMKTKQQTTEELMNTQVSGILPGVSVPLRQIAKLTPSWEGSTVIRRNGVRCISLMADVCRDANVNTETEVVSAQCKKLDLPEGVRMEIGGAIEHDNETIPGIILALTISIAIIFLILLFHYQQVSLSLTILGAIALCLFGATFGVWVMNLDFSITSVLGVISLMGIIVRNGIIMFDYTNELRHKYKMSVEEAALKSAERRMRPIFLTSAAASMGVIPMIISHSELWCPMGTVVCFGTMISMVLIITVLPVYYTVRYKNEK